REHLVPGPRRRTAAAARETRRDQHRDLTRHRTRSPGKRSAPGVPADLARKLAGGRGTWQVRSSGTPGALRLPGLRPAGIRLRANALNAGTETARRGNSTWPPARYHRLSTAGPPPAPGE